ncbi:hypothetical protein J3W29_000081 [Salmonella enterica]|uniref:Uncharacterized protein n=2 Tax=Salmonella enterica TaxID=28901 RepID=A0A629LSG9_SALER|nr:hypothetical protein [Salmonella enterica]EBV0553666.1 hypothetical protein [Salmonella enterica subsp. enterica serovar Bron]EDQ4372793.1 hypothetical protein [Salmonella enterica subsp. enterica serovar O rough]EDT5884604.1 hypothetical protein [Salmonella enterica subsp. enterica]EAB2096960.1 hypothetical protein [Salmonella enterica]EAB2136224.1 hypothetical protein [Salmonella enterica]
MDTVEELNGTYFYAGKFNLTAAELLFMIFCENTASQFGIGVADFGAVVALVSGRNNLWTRAKPAGATKGTSLIGEIILAADVSQITYRTIRDYNTIARGNDKLW